VNERCRWLHRWTKWEKPDGVRWAYGFHGLHDRELESRVCVRCGYVQWRVAR
jgi:hypothetical protein